MSNRSDEGLTLETSAFESLYGGQLTLSTQLIKPNYLLIIKEFFYSHILDMNRGSLHTRRFNRIQLSVCSDVLPKNGFAGSKRS